MKNLQLATSKTDDSEYTANTLKAALKEVLSGELKTRILWDSLKDTKTFDTWTESVHKYVLEVMLVNNVDQIIDALTDTANSCDKVLLSAFRGKLSNKLPQLRMKVTQTEGQKRRASILAANIISNVLIDEGLIVVDKVVTTTAEGSTTQMYIHFKRTNVKDKKRGICDEPSVVMQRTVGLRKISGDQKAFIKLLSDQPMALHSELSKEVINHFHTLKDDWNKTLDKDGREVMWKGTLKREHYRDTTDQILGMKGTPYYLPYKFDHRLRVSPEAHRLEGINAHGKTFETLQHCSAEGHIIDDEGMKAINQQLYSARTKRTGLEDAQSLLKPAHFNEVGDNELLSSTSHKDMANLMVCRKALESRDLHKSGLACNNLYGWDLTFSGAIMAGLLFKSPEFLVAGNLYGRDTITDAHNNFGLLFGLDGLDRDIAKTMQQPIMHGGHISTLVNLLADHGIELPADEVKAKVINVYGESVTNINTIADWGVALSRSEYSTMTWTLPDKMIGAHNAYQSGVAVDNYVISCGHKNGYAHTVQLANLPYETTSTGKPLYAKMSTVGKKSYKVSTHLRGLFADILHSVDAYVLRCIVRAVRAEGHTILVKHDNFYVHPRSYSLLMRAAKDVFKEILHSNLLEDILKEIAERSPFPANAPEMIYGGAEDKIEESNLFLLP